MKETSKISDTDKTETQPIMVEFFIHNKKILSLFEKLTSKIIKF